MEENLEDAQAKMREMRRALEELRHEKEISDSKASRVKGLEDLVTELRQANRSLEEKITRLCEAPFISDAFGQHDAQLRYEELVKQRDTLMVKVDHLQEAARTHYSALTSLKQQAAQLREEKDNADKIVEELKLKLQETETGKNMLQDKLRMYSGEDDVDMESLERALTMVKRRNVALEKLPFLEYADPNDAMVTLPSLKRKLEEYQLLNLRLTEENEKLENMLKLQSNINRDLHKELESLVYTRDKDRSEIQKKAEEFEALALTRLDKIHALEAQLRQFVYGLTKQAKSKTGFFPVDSSKMAEISMVDDGANSDDDGHNALVTELLGEKDEIRPDENLLEVWVKCAAIKDGILPPGSSTFVVIDFFDYESQTTSVVSGMNPQWDFAATYKVSVDDFLLRFLATDVITLELNMASQGDFTLLARCVIPLASLLKSKPRIRMNNHPLLSARTGQLVANISVDIRLALPISELYKLFLERHPNEKRHIEELAAKKVLEAASTLGAKAPGSPDAVGGFRHLQTVDDDNRLYNEMDIIIHRINGLPVNSQIGNKPPTAYVHFQFLGHPDKFTSPVFNSSNPEFNEKFSFPMVTTDNQIRLISRSRLTLTILDMEEEDIGHRGSANAAGYLGEVIIPLNSLGDGVAIQNEKFALKDRNNQKLSGEISVTIRWKYPFKQQRDLGPKALTGVEVETLISAFSPGNMQEGVVDYNSFCRYISPPKQALVVMETLTNYLNATLESDGQSPRELLQMLFRTNNGSRVGDRIDQELFVRQILKLQLHSILPVDLEKFFIYMDNAQEGSITVDQMIAVMNLDESSSGISVSLRMKLLERASDLFSRGVQPLHLFMEADQWGANGLVTRLEFKRVLQQMGFILADEPDVIQEVVPPEGSRKGGSKKNQPPRLELPGSRGDENDELLNTTLESDDHVLESNAEVNGQVLPKSELNTFLKQQREIFEQKKHELQQR